MFNWSNINKEIKLIIFRNLAAIGVAALLIVGLYGYAKYISQLDKSIELGTDNEKYRFTYDISKKWSEASHGYKVGEQIDLEIENHTDTVIKDWYIVLDMVEGCKIDSSWNGTYIYDRDKNIITITCVDYNETIEKGEVQPFGMVLYGPDNYCIKSGRVIYHEDKALTEMAAFWIILIVVGVIIISSVERVFFKVKEITLKEKQRESLRIINQSFITFANTIDAKDSYTKGHSQRVAFYARELAKRLGCDEDFQQNVFYVGLLHDIGKIGVQDAILKKSAKLTYDEFNEIKEHVSMGGDILRRFTAIPGIEDGARYHHEKYDGTGYMEGLKGEEIPLLARIITVADSFDAMSSARCYRSAMGNAEIIEELKRCSGTQFDPKVVIHMIDMVNEGAAPIELSEGQLEEELEF